MEKIFDAFISYGRADSQAFATKIHQKLTAQGFKIWFDKNNIYGDYPSVTILINGGAIALVDATENVKLHRPLIVIGESGRLADEIAVSLSNPEQEMRQEIASLIEMGQVSVFNISDSFSQLKESLRAKLIPSL